MEEIEYLEEYEDLVLPAINSSADAAANTHTSKLVNEDNDGSSSSLDQDIFNCLFDDNTDDDIDDIQTPLNGQEILNQREVKSQSTNLELENIEKTSDARPRAITSENIEKKRDANSVASFKNKTIATDRPTVEQKNQDLAVNTNVESEKAAKERSTIVTLKSSSKKSFARRHLVDGNSTTASSSISCKSNSSNQPKNSVCKNRPATIIKPEKIITKDPIEDPLNLDDLSSAESANFSVSDISGETYNSISDFDDEDDYDFPSKIEALDDDEDSISSQIIDISNDSSESRFQFDNLRGSTPSPVVSEDRDVQHSPTNLMANHDIIKSLLTKGERPKLLQLISKQEKSDFLNASNETKSYETSSVVGISKDDLSKTLNPKEPIPDKNTIIKSDTAPSQTCSSNNNIAEEPKKTINRRSDKIFKESEQNSSIDVSKPSKDEILQNQEVGAEMEIGNEEPNENVQEQETKKEPKILLDTSLPTTSLNAKTKKQQPLNSSDVEEKHYEDKSKEQIWKRPRKKRLKNLLSIEVNKEDEKTLENVAGISPSIQSDNSKITNKKEDKSVKNQIKFVKKIDKKTDSSLAPEMIMASKGSLKSPSKGFNKSSRNLCSENIKEGSSEGLREVPKGVIMNPFVQRGTKYPPTVGNKIKSSRKSCTEKSAESTSVDLKTQSKDERTKYMKESLYEVNSSQKSNSEIEPLKINIDTGVSNIESKPKKHEKDENRKKSISKSENIESRDMLTPEMSFGSKDNNFIEKTKAYETIKHSKKLSSTEKLKPIELTHVTDKSLDKIISITTEPCKQHVKPVDETDKRHNQLKEHPKDQRQKTILIIEKSRETIDSQSPCGKFENKQDVKEKGNNSQTITTASNTVISSMRKNNIGPEKLCCDKSSSEVSKEENKSKSETVSKFDTSKEKDFECQDDLKATKVAISEDASQSLSMNQLTTDFSANSNKPSKSITNETKNVSNSEKQPELVKRKSVINTSSIATVNDICVPVEKNKQKEDKEHKPTASTKLPKVASSNLENQVLTNKSESNSDSKMLRSNAVVNTINLNNISDFSVNELDVTNKQVSIAKETCSHKTKSLKVSDDPEKQDLSEPISIFSKTLTQSHEVKNKEDGESGKKESDEKQKNHVKEKSKITANTSKSLQEENKSPSIKRDEQESANISNKLLIRQNVKKESVSKKELNTIEATLEDDPTIIETMNKNNEKTNSESITSSAEADTLQHSKGNEECMSSKAKEQNIRKTRSTKPEETFLETGSEITYSPVQSADYKDHQVHARMTKHTKSDEEIQQNKSIIDSQKSKEKRKMFGISAELSELENVSNQTSISPIKSFIRKTRSSANTDCNISHELESLDETKFSPMHGLMNDNINKTTQRIQRKNRDTPSNCEELRNNSELEKDIDSTVDEENQSEGAMSKFKSNLDTMPQRKFRITRNSLEPKLEDNKKKATTCIQDKSSIKKDITICGKDQNDSKEKKINIKGIIINSRLPVSAAVDAESPIDKTIETPKEITSQSELNQQENTAEINSDHAYKKQSNTVNTANKDESEPIFATKDIAQKNTKHQKSIDCKFDPPFKISKNIRTSTPKLIVPIDSASRSEPIGALQKSINEANQAQSDPNDRTRYLRKRGGESPYNSDQTENNATLLKNSPIALRECQLEVSKETEGKKKRRLRSPVSEMEVHLPVHKKTKMDKKRAKIRNMDDCTHHIKSDTKVIVSFEETKAQTEGKTEESVIDHLKANTASTEKTSFSKSIIADEGQTICKVSQGMQEKINLSFSDRYDRTESTGMSQAHSDNDILYSEKSASCSILSFAEWLRENSNKDTFHKQSPVATTSKAVHNPPNKLTDMQELPSMSFKETERKQQVEEADLQVSKLSSPNRSRKVKAILSAPFNENVKTSKDSFKNTLMSKDEIIRCPLHSKKNAETENIPGDVTNDINLFRTTVNECIPAIFVGNIKESTCEVAKESSHEKCSETSQGLNSLLPQESTSEDKVYFKDSKVSSSTKSKTLRQKIGGGRRQFDEIAGREQQKNKTTLSNRQDKKTNKRTEIDILIESMPKEMKDAGIKELLNTNSNVKRQRGVAKRSYNMESVTTAPAEKERTIDIYSASASLTNNEGVPKRSPTRRSLTKKFVRDSNKSLITASKSHIPMEMEKALIDEVEIRNMNTSLLQPLKLDIALPRASPKLDSKKANTFSENDRFKTHKLLSSTTGIAKPLEYKKAVSLQTNESLSRGLSIKCRKLKVKVNRCTVTKYLTNSKSAASINFNVNSIQGDLKKQLTDDNFTNSDRTNELQASEVINVSTVTSRPLAGKTISKQPELLDTSTTATQRNSKDLQQIVSDNIAEPMAAVELKHEFLDENPNSIEEMALPDTPTLMARSHTVTQAAANALSNTIMPTDIRLLTNDPTSTRAFVPSFGVTPTLVDAKGARMYTFLHPAKYSRNHGNVLLDYCCPNLDGPMPAIDPTRIHAQVQTPVIELPSYIVLTTKVVTRAELESTSSTIPALIRKKAEKLRSHIHQLPGAATESAINVVSTPAPRIMHLNSSQYPSSSVALSVPPGCVKAVMPALKPPQLSTEAPRFSPAINALAKYLPSTTTITAKIRPDTLSNNKQQITSSVSVVAKGPTLLNEKQTNLLRSNLRRVDVIFKTLVQPFEKLNFSERHQIIDNLVASGKFLPKDLERTIVLMEEYTKQVNLIGRKQLTDTISSSCMLNTTQSHAAPMQMPPLHPAPKLADSKFKSDTTQNIEQIHKTAIRKLQSTAKQPNAAMNSTTTMKQRQVPIYDTERNIIGYQLQMITPANTTPTYSKSVSGISAPSVPSPTTNQRKSLKRPAQDSPRVFYTSQPMKTHPTQNANPFTATVKESAQTIGKSQNESFVTTVHSAGTTSDGTETITTTTMATVKRVTRSRAAGSKIIIVSKSNSSAETILPDVNQQTEIKHEKDVDDFIA